MFRFVLASLSLILALGLMKPGNARPEFLAAFQADKFRRAEIDGCSTCHVNPRGGGPRTEFGSAFQSAGHIITPMLRANFPDRFKFDTFNLPNGSAFHFSDPESKFVVFERDKQKTLLDLTTLSAKTEKEAVPLPPPKNRMTFFVTSKGLGNGAHLGGLAGADRHCQALAEAAGAGDRTWRAYLSTTFEDKPSINAGDRIGGGPWFNAKGILIANGVAELHSGNRLNPETTLNEKGEAVAPQGILTGTSANGTAAIGMTCNNWLSSAEGKAMLGGNVNSWNSAQTSSGCSQPALAAAGSDGLFYCFAAK